VEVGFGVAIEIGGTGLKVILLIGMGGWGRDETHSPCGRG
jgi:hypothetical protein